MARTIAKLLGVVFLIVGIAGFGVPGLLGAHLSPAHNVIHLVSGAVSLYLGLKGSLSAVKTFGLVFGAVYLLLGIAGFALGTTADGHTAMLRLIPNVLELGQTDHIIHIMIGGLYLAGALGTQRG